MANQTLGNIVDWAGTILGLPEMGKSESIAGGVPTSNTGKTASSQAAGLDTWRNYFFDNPPTNNTSPDTGGTVKGITTTNNNQQQQQQSSGNFMDFYPGWNPEAARADFQAQYGGDINRLMSAKGGGGSGGTQDISQLISDAYAPALQALQDIQTSQESSKLANLQNVEADYTGGKDTISREQKELEDVLASQGQQLEKSGQSAYSEAIRNLNGLFQTMASRFGAGSSTGIASGELIGQEFLRNQGKMQEQLQTGRQSISQEYVKVKNYVSDKISSLDSWKRDAVQKINDNFQAQLAEIGLRRGEIEANKTNARIAALQDAVSRAREINDREREFKLGLAQFAVETMQSASAKTFTPQEIAGVVNDMLGAQLNNFVSSTLPAGGGITYNPSALRGKTQDELRKSGVLA